MIFRLSPDPRFGVQLQDQAIQGVNREGRIDLTYRERPGQFDDRAAYSLREPTYAIAGAASHVLQLSPRVPPAIFGGGMLEAVDVATLRAIADPNDEDGDGVSGRLSIISDTKPDLIGRFGWKATRATLRDQVIEAAAEDIGLASRERPLGSCSPDQADAIAACAQPMELGPASVEALVAYLRGLAAPARRDPTDPTVLRGEALFAEAGCARCHRPSLPTGDYPPMPALGGRTIHAYTDLLLHDMGEGLADNLPDGAANGREWRTPPLWGIGLVPTVNGHSYFLHDGRARSLMEAVLWHGGEAAAARRAVIGWSETDRAALVAFLMSL